MDKQQIMVIKLPKIASKKSNPIYRFKGPDFHETCLFRLPILIMFGVPLRLGLSAGLSPPTPRQYTSFTQSTTYRCGVSAPIPGRWRILVEYTESLRVDKLLFKKNEHLPCK